jgi:hypothetical protein
MMSGLLLGMVLSVCIWFHYMITFPSWLVSTDFCWYQYFLSNFYPYFLAYVELLSAIHTAPYYYYYYYYYYYHHHHHHHHQYISFLRSFALVLNGVFLCYQCQWVSFPSSKFPSSPDRPSSHMDRLTKRLLCFVCGPTYDRNSFWKDVKKVHRVAAVQEYSVSWTWNTRSHCRHCVTFLV